ncbi:hypothetical protein IWX90DRAFT_188494 [Phyllosticta citrichinensis]|uniref:Uncharacterized protein n=1 Tax=Phyllosticta citrichinensis TaxID=1130410 RepID=A0ABR1XWT6_9PEZI
MCRVLTFGCVCCTNLSLTSHRLERCSLVGRLRRPVWRGCDRTNTCGGRFQHLGLGLSATLDPFSSHQPGPHDDADSSPLLCPIRGATPIHRTQLGLVNAHPTFSAGRTTITSFAQNSHHHFPHGMQSKQTAYSTNLSPTIQPVSQSPTRRLLAMLPHGLKSWPHRTAWWAGGASPRVCFARIYPLRQSDHGARVDGDLSASPASPPGSSFPEVWGSWYRSTPTSFR